MNAKPSTVAQRIAVTGAFGSLGSTVAAALAARGAHVALLDVAAQPPASLRERFASPHALIGGADLTQSAAAQRAFATAAERLGGLDALVNVAGGFRWEKLEGGAVETWDALYAMNLKSAVVATQAALPLLLAAPAGTAAIVNVGAGAALAPAAAGMGAYLASKAGVQRLTESLADELKGRGVRVNAVLPGTMDTPQNRADMPDVDPASWVRLAAVAEVVAFLVSGAARGVTGASIPVTHNG